MSDHQCKHEEDFGVFKTVCEDVKTIKNGMFGDNGIRDRITKLEEAIKNHSREHRQYPTPWKLILYASSGGGAVVLVATGMKLIFG